MSLPQRIHDRFRPWYLLDVVAFLFGVASPPDVRPAAILRGVPPDTLVLVEAAVSGLLGVVVLRFTVGTAWGYAVEYVDAGGSWTDGPLWAPAAAGAVAAVASSAATTTVGAAVWTGFWVFAFVAGAAAVAVSFAAGYRDAAG